MLTRRTRRRRRSRRSASLRFVAASSSPHPQITFHRNNTHRLMALAKPSVFFYSIGSCCCWELLDNSLPAAAATHHHHHHNNQQQQTPFTRLCLRYFCGCTFLWLISIDWGDFRDPSPFCCFNKTCKRCVNKVILLHRNVSCEHLCRHNAVVVMVVVFTFKRWQQQQYFALTVSHVKILVFIFVKRKFKPQWNEIALYLLSVQRC